MTDLADGMVNRVQVLEDLDGWLADPTRPLTTSPADVPRGTRTSVPARPRRPDDPPDVARWGEGADAVAGQRAMMAVAGNPPPHWKLLAERKQREIAQRTDSPAGPGPAD